MREMRIGETLDGAIKLYRRYWKALMAMVAWVIVPFAFLQQFATRVNGRLHFEGGRVVAETPSGRAGPAAVLIFVGLSYLFVQPFLTAAMARAASRLYLGEEPDVRVTYRYALSAAHSILWVSFLTLLAILGGLILLIIPGIIFAIRFLFGSTVVVVEGVKGREAMRRSWHLAKGSFWRIFATVLLAGLLASVISAVLTIPTTAASLFAGSGGWAVRGVGAALASVIVTPFTVLVRVLLYFDMRIRKEGFDLAVIAQDLAGPRAFA
jgi:hypothetical protein